MSGLYVRRARRKLRRRRLQMLARVGFSLLAVTAVVVLMALARH